MLVANVKNWMSAPPQRHQHAQVRSKGEDSRVSCFNWAPGFIVNPTAIVIEHGRGRADASWRVYALAHAVLDEFNLLRRYGLWVLWSGRGVNKRSVNDGHIVVQHIHFGQPRRVEELEVRRPASDQCKCWSIVAHVSLASEQTPPHKFADIYTIPVVQQLQHLPCTA